jgi:dTDP-4-amino-4,6-dideoxygalactose transaminase
MNSSDQKRHNSDQVIIESHDVLGYNYRMTDLQAALGRAQLARLPLIIENRRALARRYETFLKSLPKITPPAEPAQMRSNWQSYCVRLAPDVNRNQVMQKMLIQGISTKPGIMCAHLEPAYTPEDWIQGSSLKQSELARNQGLLLPLFAQMTNAEQDHVVQALAEAIHD